MLQNLRPSCLPLVLVTLAMLLTSCTSVQRDEDPCSYGVYVKGQEKVVLSDGYRGSGPPQTAYTFIDGRRGNLGTQDAELRCVAGVLYDKAGQPYQSLPLSEQDFSFESNGVTLAGRLIIPPSREGDAQPLAVFVHGSENTVTVGHSRYPWILAAQGVSVFVYDKRGTGQSEGTYTQDFQILADDAAAAFRTDDNVDWHYDAVAVIRSLSIPQLWVIAENDRAAPGQLTYERLRSLQAEGKQITTALFPNTDHGMVEFTELANGERQYTRFTDGYFRLIADYVKGVFAAPYGNGKVVLPSRNHR
jgi:pimeloyl-ACP methyl ester carboxylesterase